MQPAPYRYEDQLESTRLMTRFLTMEDVQEWADFFKDKEAIELFPASFFPSGADHAAQWIGRQMERYQHHLYGLQAIISKETGQFVGQCGLIEQEVDGQKELEVGYHIFKKYWGNGYAPEAAKMFIDYALNNGLAESVISIIDVRNVKSQRVAEKNGLIRDKQTNWKGLDVFIYRTVN